ncbi:MAG: hypothetical protein ACI9DK_000011 [Vicingaceae bacterium]|jgi:hypothetical protein|tara:strand:- start:57 stop:320 length:264 start_codon:yes stop_codon:yes gene_type:complete
MKNIQHKIRGSQPGFIGIELPDNYSVLLLDEDNFNSYRKEGRYYGQNIEVKDSYAHFQKPVDGSWHVVVEGKENFFPESVHIIYKAA